MGERWIVLCLVGICLGACEDDDRLPCPPKGIGVEPLQPGPDASGVKCSGGYCVATPNPDRCGDHPDMCRQTRCCGC
jgi:hypothetical protein